MNFAILFGAVILLGMAVVFVFALWTTINIVVWNVQRRRAEREFRDRHRRADGKAYPAAIEGVCSRCARGHRRVYFTPTGEELCALCYERFWRTDEAPTEPAAAVT